MLRMEKGYGQKKVLLLSFQFSKYNKPMKRQRERDEKRERDRERVEKNERERERRFELTFLSNQNLLYFFSLSYLLNT